ncbi:MAG: hypothetical protein LBF63_05650 [Treponema sp.]|nr:hypothetical protein [Treponema sp.]
MMKHYILSKLDEYKAVFNERPKLIPSDAVVDAPIAGNGDIGIAVNAVDSAEGRGHPGSTGGGDIKPIPLDHAVEAYVTKNDFWKGAYGCTGPDRYGIRSLGKLQIVLDQFGGCAYYAEQIIRDGTITVKLDKGEYGVLLTLCVPRGENLIVAKVKNLGKPLTGRAGLRVTRAPDAEYSEHYADGFFSIEKSYTGPELAFPTAARAVGRVLDSPDSTFSLEEGGEALVIVSVFTNHDSADYREKAKALPEKLTRYNVVDILAKNRAWWRDFWLSSGLRLPAEPLAEKFWYASHYIMASCCGNREFPPGLFGNWITTDRPNWAGDYHLNYNYQAPFWGLYSSNKIGLTEGYDAPLMDFIPAAQDLAWRDLGCRGIYSPVGLGPKGLGLLILDKDDNNDVSFWGQKSNASYAAVNMLMRFYSSYDLDYARTTAYPYLKEAGAFWEDYLVFKDGRYWIFNDCIHENGFLANKVAGWDWGVQVDYAADCNPLLSLGLIRMVFRGLLDISRELGDDNPAAKKWRHILDHLSPYPVQKRNGKTVFRYTETGMDWCEGNSLGIQHVFPAGGIGLGSDKELLEIARATLVELDRWEDYNAFPTFYAAAARLGHDPAEILRHLNEEIHKHAYPNLYIYYGGGGIECCSGVPACLNEMLLQSHEGILRFFPVWEQDKDAEFYNLRAYGAFLVSASLREGKIGDISIYSEKGRRCVFQPPFEGCRVFHVDGVEQRPVSLDAAPDAGTGAYAFGTQPGGRYLIRK